MDHSRARIDKLCFAMRWNKIEYAQIYILNPNTIIEWTVREILFFIKKIKYFRMTNLIDVLK
jgi:hypothetical protein